ncbi:MAG: DUF378 domain-containing protein [Candidatus Paceibacterota bacterium]|jgi:hypothetical protein
MQKLNALGLIALILVIIGGLNWGLVGFFSFNLVAALFGASSMLTKIVYDLVGLSALYVAFVYFMGKE